MPEAADPDCERPFKGDLDLPSLKKALADYGDRVALVLLTLTNNAVGGQPVSMANIEAVGALCRKAGVPFFLDAARFAENAWFIRAREPGYAGWDLREIVGKAFRLAEGCTLSAKKDGIVHIGGLLATSRDDMAEAFRCELILSEGFTTYGGLAGRDLEAMAVGLEEALETEYLRYRIRSVAYFAEQLEEVGMPIVKPPGGHAVFIDAGRLLDHLPAEAFPAQSLAAALYLEGGVRGVEVGSLMFPQARLQLLRLAVPRRVYTQSHIDYVVEVAQRVVARAGELPGYRIVKEPPFLRHFSARLEPTSADLPEVQQWAS